MTLREYIEDEGFIDRAPKEYEGIETTSKNCKTDK